MTLDSTRRYKVYKDGTNTRLVSLDNMAIDSSNSSSDVVLNVASANVTAKGALYMLPGTYSLDQKWNLVNRNIRVIGERSAHSGNFGQTGDTIIKANYTDAVGPLIDCHHTGYAKTQFENIVVDCNQTVKIGIDAFDISECHPFIKSVGIFQATGDGLLISDVHYVTMFDLVVGKCGGAGLHCNGTSAPDQINTLSVFGGRISSCLYDVLMEGYNTGNYIYATILEGNNDDMAFNNLIRLDGTQCNYNVFHGCSVEYAGAVNKEVLYIDGRNNEFQAFRFDSYHSTYTPIRFGPNAVNNIIQNPKFMANNVGTTAEIIADSGAINNRIVNPAVAVNTPLEVVIKNAGGRYALLCEGVGRDNFHAIDTIVPSPMIMRSGQMFTGPGWVESGLYQGMLDVGNGTVGSFDSTLNGRSRKWDTAGAAGDNAGTNTTSAMTCRNWYPRKAIRFKTSDIANSRLYMGYSSNGSDPAGDDPLNALAGFFFGKISSNGDWLFMHNDTSGATVVDDVLNIVADNNIHTIYLEATPTAVYWQLDNNDIFKVTADLPSAGGVMAMIYEIESVNAGAKTIELFEADMRSF